MFTCTIISVHVAGRMMDCFGMLVLLPECKRQIVADWPAEDRPHWQLTLHKLKTTQQQTGHNTANYDTVQGQSPDGYVPLTSTTLVRPSENQSTSLINRCKADLVIVHGREQHRG